VPEISRFHGIRILMYREAGERHHRKHFHAVYGERAAVFDLESGDVLAGDLPARQRSLVEAWRSLHALELALLWDRLGAGAPAFRIDPLP
jgi:hypothetical protein